MADQNQGLESSKPQSQPQPQLPTYGVNDRYGIIGNQILLDNNNNLMDSPTAQIIVPIAPSKVYPPIPPDTYVVHSVPKMVGLNSNFNINMPFGAVPTQSLARGPPVVFVTPKPATPVQAIPASDHHAPYSSSPLSAQPQSASGYSNPLQDAPGEPSSTLRERTIERYRNSSKEEKLKALINALRDSTSDPTHVVLEAIRDIAHEQHEKSNAAEKKVKQLEGKLEFAKVQYSSALDLSESLRREKNLLLEENKQLKADLQLLKEGRGLPTEIKDSKTGEGENEMAGNGFGGQSTTEASGSLTNAGRETRSARKKKLVSDPEMASSGEESPTKRRR